MWWFGSTTASSCVVQCMISQSWLNWNKTMKTKIGKCFREFEFFSHLSNWQIDKIEPIVCIELRTKYVERGKLVVHFWNIILMDIVYSFQNWFNAFRHIHSRFIASSSKLSFDLMVKCKYFFSLWIKTIWFEQHLYIVIKKSDATSTRPNLKLGNFEILFISNSIHFFWSINNRRKNTLAQKIQSRSNSICDQFLVKRFRKYVKYWSIFFKVSLKFALNQLFSIDAHLRQIWLI